MDFKNSIRSSNGLVYFVDSNDDEKVFKLDLNAVADLEALLGKGINALVSSEHVGMNTIRGFYWAGFKFKYKGMTLEKAGKWVQRQVSNGVEFDELMVPVIEALIASGIMKREDVDDEDEYNEEEDDGFNSDTNEEDSKN